MAQIIETATVWPESFYKYHQMFSSKCASMLLQHNIKIDWAKGDFELRTLICAGSSVKSYCQRSHPGDTKSTGLTFEEGKGKQEK